MKITCPPGSLVVDASLWNNSLKTQELIDGGVTSVILGLYKQWSFTKFKYLLNDNCKRIIDQICASSLILQTYFYYYPQNNPITDANWFVDQMAGYPVKFAWADCEAKTFPMTQKLRSEQFRRFTAQVALRFPKTGVYTSRSFILEYAPEMNLWIGKYPSWIAHYGKQPKLATPVTWEQLKASWLPNYEILIPAGSTNVVGHQFSDRFILPGAYDLYDRRMTLDVNVFTSKFIEAIKQNQVPVPAPMPPPPVPQPNTYTVNIGFLNVRSSPDNTTDANKIGMIARGTHVIVDQVNYQWAHFLPQTGFLKGGWVWSAYITKA